MDLGAALDRSRPSPLPPWTPSPARPSRTWPCRTAAAAAAAVQGRRRGAI